MEHLSDVDRQVCECIEARYVQNGYYRDVVYDLDVDRALPRLMGHPHLYQDGDPDTVMEIVDSRPALRLESTRATCSCGSIPLAAPTATWSMPWRELGS